jgi:hypothetical protein
VTSESGNRGTGPARPNDLLSLLFFVEDLLVENDVFHWLDWGTLLGAVRDGELISWDSDADLGVMAGGVERVLELAPVAAAAGRVLEPFDHGVRVRHGAADKPHVDIYAWQEEDGLVTPLATTWHEEWPGMAGRERFPASYLGEPATVVLQGRPFPAPSPVHRFLAEHRYGPDYLTPRPPILNARLYGGNVAYEELTPRVTALLGDVARAERLLTELSPPSRSHARLRVRWWAGGLPLEPAPDRVQRLRSPIPDAEMTPLVGRLVDSLALLEQAIDEREHPRSADPVRRAGRRAARSWEGVAASLHGRPRRRGFPYGS